MIPETKRPNSSWLSDTLLALSMLLMCGGGAVFVGAMITGLWLEAFAASTALARRCMMGGLASVVTGLVFFGVAVAALDALEQNAEEPEKDDSWPRML